VALISHLPITMRVPGIVFVALGAVATGGELAHAQNPLALPDGASVRVTAPVLPTRLYGQAILDRLNPDVLTISTPGDDARVVLPLASTSRIEVNRGRARAKGALIGATVGLLAGGAFGAKAGEGDPIASLAGTAVFSGVGSVVGGVLGFAYAPERWRTVYSNTATDVAYGVTLSSGARIARLENGAIAVRGARNRRAGMMRGAMVLAGVGVVFGGIDKSRGNLSSGNYATAVIGNAVVGAAVGYLISPRGWQQLPPSRASATP
jgi:hypothetical protein